MICPSCEKHIQIPIKKPLSFTIQARDVFDQVELLYVYGDYCPACSEILVVLAAADRIESPEFQGVVEWDTPRFREIIYPRRRAIRPLPPEVPHEFRDDHDEAVLVVDLSPKSSAAPSRRLLQRILHSHFNIVKRDLYQEIRELIDTLQPPAHLSQQLDAIRAVGNFAAHPLKNTATGEISDVEPGEAEWLIETLESLFDFAFVQPSRFAARKAAINAKLKAAGKPELP